MIIYLVRKSFSKENMIKKESYYIQYTFYYIQYGNYYIQYSCCGHD